MTESQVYLRDGESARLIEASLFDEITAVKVNYPKEWFEQRIEKEGKVEIGAGIPAAPRLSRPSASPG